MDSDNDKYGDADLKPCPFCGGKASIWTKGKRVFWVKCNICQNSIKWDKDLENCVLRWNNRPIEEKLEAEVNRLRGEHRAE